MKQFKQHSLVVAAVLLVIASASLFISSDKRRGRLSTPFSLPRIVRAAEANPWTRGIEKVKEDRGEATGKQAKVDIPSELRHYSDTRRFLAVQVAEFRQHALSTPQDLVDLAAMIRSGEFVTLNPVTDDYILIGVGGNASKEPFTRFVNGKSVNLYDEAGLRLEYDRLAEATTRAEHSLADAKKELADVGKRERAKRARLQSQVSAFEKSLKELRDDKRELDRNYGSDTNRAQLFTAYSSVANLANTFPDRNFDISDAKQRRDLKVRLLSSLRPEALKVMEEIASSYREKFDRPLPITSLVRPDEYQLALSKVNPNATKIETPPHSTGLAFDIFYRYMTAAEQAHVMSHLAQLKDAGRIEVLRENRDHYHVFAFIDGARPKEELITASLGHRATSVAAPAPAQPAKSAKPGRKKVAVKAKAKTNRKTARRR